MNYRSTNGCLSYSQAMLRTDITSAIQQYARCCNVNMNIVIYFIIYAELFILYSKQNSSRQEAVTVRKTTVLDGTLLIFSCHGEGWFLVLYN